MITSSTTTKKAGPVKEILKPGNQVRVHLQGTPARYTCRVHLQGTPARYTCKVHLQGTPARYTCKVHLQGKWRRAVVSKHLPEPRSYKVETDDGTRYRRNRMHIHRNYGLPMARRELFRTMQATTPNNVNDASTATRHIARPPEMSQPSRPPEMTQPTSQPSFKSSLHPTWTRGQTTAMDKGLCLELRTKTEYHEL